MSINSNNSNSISSDVILERAVGQILRGHSDGALSQLTKCGLFGDEQIEKIQAILTEMNPTHLTIMPLELKARLLQAINPETEAAQTLPQNKPSHIGFTETPACEFANAYPCKIEFGGAGIVESGFSDNKMIPDLKNRCQFVVPQLNEDIVSEIFEYSFSGGDIKGIQSLACTNKCFYTYITKIEGALDFKQFCPGLIILDAQTLGLVVDDEPPIKKLALIKNFRDMAFKVENNAGLTLLTMTKGLTLNQLVAIAAKARITVHFGCNGILKELGDVPVEHTYRVVITNNVFINSRNKSYEVLLKDVLEIGCEMPPVQEYVALCIYTQKIFNLCLYGQDRWKYGRSSTHVKKCPLAVGFSAPSCLVVDIQSRDLGRHGAGGHRQLEH